MTQEMIDLLGNLKETTDQITAAETDKNYHSIHNNL